MAVFSGPEIVNDGLVFHYDMGNTEKSWKGKPTTNLCANPSLSTDSNWNRWGGRGELSWYHTVYQGQYAYYSDCTTETGESHQLFQDITVPAVETIYTLSMEVLMTPDCNAGGIFVTTEYPFGNTYSGGTAFDPSRKGVWQRVVSIRDNLYTGGAPNTRMRFYFGHGSGATTGKVYFRNPQMEVGTFATPFVNGTRSNTQAILDLIGNNTVTADSLTYNSNGSFTFESGINYLRVSDLDSYVGDVTLESVVDLYAANGPHQTAVCTDQNYRYGIKLMASYHGNTAAWLGFGTSEYLLTGSNIQNTGIKFITVTRSASTGLVSLYHNGNLVNSGTGTTGNMSQAGTGHGRVGLDYHSGGYGFNGKIYASKVYNRVLSAEEIQQNFEAHRTRFGI